MPVRLLNADHDIAAVPMQMLGLVDGQIDGVILVMAVTDHRAVLVNHIPTILGLIVVDMNRMVGARFGSFGHDQRPRRALPTFLRLLPTRLTALRTAEADFLVFFAS